MAFHKPLLSLLKRRALDSHSVKPPQTITSSAEGALSSKLVYTFSPLVFIFSFYSDSISCRFQTYYNYNTNALLKRLTYTKLKKIEARRAGWPSSTPEPRSCSLFPLLALSRSRIFTPYTASAPVSSVRIRIASSTGRMNTLPSPILPVFAAPMIAFEASSN